VSVNRSCRLPQRCLTHEAKWVKLGTKCGWQQTEANCFSLYTIGLYNTRLNCCWSTAFIHSYCARTMRNMVFDGTSNDPNVITFSCPESVSCDASRQLVWVFPSSMFDGTEALLKLLNIYSHCCHIANKLSLLPTVLFNVFNALRDWLLDSIDPRGLL
jgi:hypothetical protein